MDVVQSLDVTRTTYRVADFLSWQRGGNLSLRPVFQRNSVWTEKAKSFFMDSVVRGFPVPLIFIQDKTDPKTYEPQRLVVDGQQRIRTLLAFVDAKCLADRQASDNFSVLRIHNPDIADKTFEQLPEEVRERILGFQFSVHVLPSTTPNAVLLEIFARMNATGLKLNNQELRNAAFSGAFKQVAYELAFGQVENWRGWGIFRDSQLARMLEVEFVSELLMFMSGGLQAKRQAAIDKEYKTFEDDYRYERVARKRFAHVFDVLSEVYGRIGDRSSSDDVKGFRNQSWFYAVFAFAYDLSYQDHTSAKHAGTAAKRLDRSALAKHVSKRCRALAKGEEVPPELLKALRGASTDRVSRDERYRFIKRGWRSA
ncbi:MAG: DUF262 domain-containing protein [Vicinamibacterales bacterium]